MKKKDILFWVIVVSFFGVFIWTMVTPSNKPDLNGASWECLQCFGPGNDSGWCKITPDYGCNWNCTHDNKTTYLYKSKCDKAILVKYLEG